MNRTRLGLLVGVPFLLATVALVQVEGRSYRQALRASRATRTEAPPRARPAPLPEVQPAAEPPASPPGPAPAAAPPALPAAPEPPAAVATPEPTPEPEPTPAPKVIVNAAPAPAWPELDLAGDPRSWTIDQERRLGRALHEVIVARHRLARSGDLQRVVREAAAPILAARQRRDVDYQFFLLDGEDINAFSHPGGYIYLSRGLFYLLADEAELQFVLAHEVAHVDRRHDAEAVARAVRDAQVKGREPPNLLAAFYRQIAVGHGDDDEFAADEWAFRQLARLGHTRHAILSFPRRLLAYVEAHGIEPHARPRSAPDDAVQDVANHWPSHPPAAVRLERLLELPAPP